ncbi:cation:proton antiporter [Oricola sp.]|uniref:cation:proton antiporter n=1 Tax=Oricola sp. TaxID=1979950 RepID=UPI003BAC13F6
MPNAQLLIVIGVLLLASLALETLGRLTRLPRVTIVVLFGVLIGPSGLGLLPDAAHEIYPTLSVLALVMVSFLLGGRLTRRILAESGAQIISASMLIALATAFVVATGLIALGFDPVLALLFAGIMTATDPAATEDVVRRSRATGPFPTILLGVVALDDAWGLILFGILMATAQAMTDGSLHAAAEVFAIEIGGAVAIGLGIGIPAAFLTGRIRRGEPIQAEAIGVVCLIGGISVLLEASFLLAAMIAGMVIANLARHHTRAFHEIERIEWPFMVLFFVLAGASLDIATLASIGALGIAVIALRAAGRLISGPLAGVATGMPAGERRWIGIALMPQAGVAMGMALVAANAFPDRAETIIATTVGATVVFELVGPLLTVLALRRSGSTDRQSR